MFHVIIAYKKNCILYRNFIVPFSNKVVCLKLKITIWNSSLFCFSFKRAKIVGHTALMNALANKIDNFVKTNPETVMVSLFESFRVEIAYLHFYLTMMNETYNWSNLQQKKKLVQCPIISASKYKLLINWALL